MSYQFTWPARVYWEDTDGGGVVYHSRYVNFFERARTEWFRALGYNQSILQREHDLLFAIRRMHINFISPARMDDQLIVTLQVSGIRAASVDFEQTILRQHSSNESEQIATAMVYAASLSASTFKPVRIPSDMRQSLQ